MEGSSFKKFNEIYVNSIAVFIGYHRLLLLSMVPHGISLVFIIGVGCERSTAVGWSIVFNTVVRGGGSRLSTFLV